MTGEEVLKALAALVMALATVGGAILWIARLAAEKVVAENKAKTDKALDDLEKQIGDLKVEVAELRGEARPLLAAMERTLHLLEVRR